MKLSLLLKLACRSPFTLKLMLLNKVLKNTPTRSAP